MKPTNDKCTGIFPLFWFTQILNSTASIIASDSRIQDDLGQWIRCHWRLRDESEPIPGPDWSLGSIYWAPIASELPSEVTSDPSIQGKYGLEVQPGSGYYSSWNQQKRKKPRSWAVPVTENLEMIVKKFQKSFKRIWCDTSIWIWWWRVHRNHLYKIQENLSLRLMVCVFLQLFLSMKTFSWNWILDHTAGHIELPLWYFEYLDALPRMIVIFFSFLDII